MIGVFVDPRSFVETENAQPIQLCADEVDYEEIRP